MDDFVNQSNVGDTGIDTPRRGTRKHHSPRVDSTTKRFSRFDDYVSMVMHRCKLNDSDDARNQVLWEGFRWNKNYMRSDGNMVKWRSEEQGRTIGENFEFVLSHEMEQDDDSGSNYNRRDHDRNLRKTKHIPFYRHKIWKLQNIFGILISFALTVALGYGATVLTKMRLQNSNLAQTLTLITGHATLQDQLLTSQSLSLFPGQSGTVRIALHNNGTVPVQPILTVKTTPTSASLLGAVLVCPAGQSCTDGTHPTALSNLSVKSPTTLDVGASVVVAVTISIPSSILYSSTPTQLTLDIEGVQSGG